MTAAFSNGVDASEGADLTWTTTALNAANYKLLKYPYPLPPGTAPNYSNVYDGPNLTWHDPATTGTYAYRVIVEDSNGNSIVQSNPVVIYYDIPEIDNNPGEGGLFTVGISTIGGPDVIA